MQRLIRTSNKKLKQVSFFQRSITSEREPPSSIHSGNRSSKPKINQSIDVSSIYDGKLINTESCSLEVISPQGYKDGKPLITVMGVGGAGGNAVNNMIFSNLKGIEFVVANTDCQALERSLCDRKIALGPTVTYGLGAGSNPELGRKSAEEQRDDLAKSIAGSNMLFITGGMGGGTCTGAAPVVAQIARDMDILTVGVVSTPFRSEGPNRTRIAHTGVNELKSIVDTLIVVPNQNLLALSNERTTMLEAFSHADTVLLQGVKGVTDLIMKPGLINLDFADINAILSNAGRAMMGSGSSECSNRATVAAEKALANPLLGELPTESANGLLVTISGSSDVTLFEVDKVMSIIRDRVAKNANIIFGTCYDESLAGSLHVSIIIGGIQTDDIDPPVGKMVHQMRPLGEATESKGNSINFLGNWFSFKE